MAVPDNIGFILLSNALYAKTPPISFSIPQVNTTRIMSDEGLISRLKTYYGDEIDLKFWRMLHLAFGAVPSPSNPLTRIDGYLYVFHHVNKTFDAYDDNGVNFFHVDNVTNIAQMNIDFTIANSHQFEIITNMLPSGFGRFVFPVLWNKRTFDADMQPNIMQGVNSSNFSDRVRPYAPDDSDNPIFYIKHIGNISLESEWEEFYYRNAQRFIEADIWAIGRNNKIDWQKNMPTNYFYVTRKDVFPIVGVQFSYWPDLYDPTKCYRSGEIVRGIENYGDTLVDNIFAIMGNSSCGTCMQNGVFNENGSTGNNSFNIAINDTSRVFDAQLGRSYKQDDIILYNGVYYLVLSDFVATDFSIDIIYLKQICTLLKRLIRRTIANKQNINPIFAKLSMALYPKFMPIERAGETHNNRPLYEPWLIYPYDFFVSHWSPYDDEDVIPPIFDLSPRWL